MSSGLLSQINVFPVKSLGGLALSSAWVEKQGLTFDRRFMLALSDGSMVTARKFPQMVLIKPRCAMMVCCFLHKVIPRLPSVMQTSSFNQYPHKFGRIISLRTPPPMKQTIGLVRC